MLCFIITNQKFETQPETNKQTNKKKTKKDVKEVLLKSIKETDDEYDPNLDEMGENVRILKNVITVIKRYEDIIKTQKKKIICLVDKQGQILNKIENSEQLCETVDLSKSTIYFESMCTSLSPNARF